MFGLGAGTAVRLCRVGIRASFKAAVITLFWPVALLDKVGSVLPEVSFCKKSQRSEYLHEIPQFF